MLLQADQACREVRAARRVQRSEEFPEKVATVQEPVTERDLQYLTIGIVVNAPYGRRRDVVRTQTGSSATAATAVWI